MSLPPCRLAWGASKIVTVSYRPCVQKNVLHSHSKRLSQFLEGFCPFRRFLSVADSLIGELRKNDISYHGHPPWLGPCATWHEEVVLRLPQQHHCGIDLYHRCFRHAWPEGRHRDIQIAAPQSPCHRDRRAALARY